jgi:deazaflavin-dependent oxidoreductase (nitroreductase family)
VRTGHLLATIGRTSGVERQTPVGWFPDQDGSWLIVASAAGAARNPAWYHNLAAHPDQVWIETAGRRVAMTAEQLHGRSATRRGRGGDPMALCRDRRRRWSR